MNQQVTPPPTTTRSGLKHSIWAHIRRTMLTAIVALCALTAWAQGISYQAVLRDANGQIMANQEVKLRLSILYGATPVYQEEQTATTTPQGVINIAIGEGNATDGTFADIDWSQAYDLLVEVDASESGTYAAMPTTPLRPVPQAYHAKWAENLKTSGSKGVTLEAQSTIDDDSLLFGVRNNKGDLVFAVYNNAVAVYVDTTPNGRPTQRAGFAVGGMAGRDGKQGKPLLQVDLSGTTVHVDDGAEATNGGRPVQKASFAVGGMAGRDSEQWQTLFNVDATGTKVHVDPPSEGGRPVQKASFAVGGMAGRATVAPLFRVDSVGTTVLVDDTSKAQGRPVQKASFAVGGMAGRAGDAANYFVVTKDSTRVYVDDRDARPVQKASFAVGGMAGRAGGGRYMDITKDNYIIGHGAGTALMNGTATGKNNSIMGTDAAPKMNGNSNVAIGNQAGNAVTTGDYNVFVGANSARLSKKTSQTVAIGYQAGEGVSTSDYQNGVFVGYRAGYNNKTGNNNVFIGSKAGVGNTTGSSNIFIGDSAALGNTSGKNNVVMGKNAGMKKSTGSDNVLIGTNAYAQANGGLQNVLIGNAVAQYAKLNNTVVIGDKAGQGVESNSVTSQSGENSVAIGVQAGHKRIGNFNVFVGYNSGQNNESGANNVFLGNQTGLNNTTGASNVIIGNQAGYTNTASQNNVFIGNKAGYTTKGTGTISVTNPRTNGNETVYDGSNNVFLGNEAGYLNTTGYNNVFLGNYAGVKNTTATNNVFVGFSTGASNTTGASNVFVGNQAGAANTTASNNVFMGYYAGNANTTGASNVFLGESAGVSNKVANSNVFIGTKAGYSTVGERKIEPHTGEVYYTGANNVFIGTESGYANKDGRYNVLIGYNAGKNGTGIINSVMIGNNAGLNSVKSNSAVFIGDDAGLGTTTGGDGSVYIGGRAGMSNTTGKHNIAIGTIAGYSNMNGSNNIFIGYCAGYSNLGSGNVFIGDNAGRNETGSNKLYIANSTQNTLIKGDFSTGEVWIQSKLYANGTQLTSDRRLKTDIRPLENALAKVMKLNGVSYKWRSAEFKERGFDENRHAGVLAQEVEAVLPEAVHTGEDGYKSVSYNDLVPLLIEAVKEQQKQIDELKKLVEQLMKK